MLFRSLCATRDGSGLFPWILLSESNLRDGGLIESVGGPGQFGHPHDEFVADGLLDAGAATADRGVLTLRGRLMADAVTRALADG